MPVKERKITAVETRDGAGVRIRRLFPSPELDHYDPFVLFDEFFLREPAGFPLHPHRGFEAVTYMLEGGFHHRDTAGNDTTVLAGGLQRFSAGRGLEHSEMPGTPGLNHGIQLWVKLPGDLRNSEPDYEQADPRDIPVVEDVDAIVRAVAGGESPVRLRTDIRYYDITLKTKRAYDFRIPEGFRGFAYLIDGSIVMEDTKLSPGEAFFLEEGRTEGEVSAETWSRFLLLEGRPHREPIRLHGSFVD